MSRSIGGRLFGEFDNRLKNVAQARNCLSTKDARGLLVEAARVMINVIEEKPNQGAVIDLMHEVGGSSAGDAWCMSFVQSCIAYVEQKLKIVSPIFHSPGCLSVWNKTPQVQRVKTLPLGGAILIWQSDQNPNLGHTGIVLDCDGTTMHDIEGNTSPSKSIDDPIAREGDGVFLCNRRWNLLESDERGLMLLGAIKPF